MTDAREEFRGFALALYGGAGVSEAALLLQDRRGVDVNLLLLAAYVGVIRGVQLSEADVAAAREHTAQWQAEVVGPLRAIRQRLREGPAPAPNAATAALRDRVKALELDAELIELDALSDFLAGLAPEPGAGRVAAALLTVARGATTRDLTDDEHAAVTVIAAAATRLGEE